MLIKFSNENAIIIAIWFVDYFLKHIILTYYFILKMI